MLVAVGRALAACLLPLVLSSMPAAADEGGGFIRFLFGTPQAVAARDPGWTYTLQRYLNQPEPPAKPAVTGSLPPAPGQVAALSRPRGAPPAPQRAESITGPSHSLSGLASFYWQPQMTANGEVFDPRQMTAAHKTLPFGTKVRVTDLRTGRAVVVRINDRGPYKPGRIIDLSQAAAHVMGMASVGITPVKLEVLGR